jgi:hypothetical protein
VVGKPGRRGGRAGPLLQRLADRRVQLAALGAGQAVLEHLADQRVPEPVRRAGRADAKQPTCGSLIQQPGRSLLADAAHLAQQVVLDRLRCGLGDDRGRGQQ